MRLRMNLWWTLGFAVIAVLDIKKIIRGYQLQQTICGQQAPTTGLTDVTCIGSVYQFSVFHLAVVLATLLILNLKSTQLSTKVILLTVYALSISLLIGGILFFPAIIVGICGIYLYEKRYRNRKR